MDWLAIEVRFERNLDAVTLDNAADLLSLALEPCGANGVETRPNAGVVIAYLPADVSAGKRLLSAKDAIEALYLDGEQAPPPIAVRVRRYGDERWLQKLYGALKPQRFGSRLVVVPAWEQFEPQPGDTILTLERCQAFGTGDHPTTRMCLELLEETVRAGDVVVDIGCGSGILSIAAVKLGAAYAVALDNDPIAVEAAGENVSANGVAESIAVLEASGFDFHSPIAESFTLAVSNIISSVILSLIPEACRTLSPGARWILSGIIRSNWAQVEQALLKADCSVDSRQEFGEWVAAVVRTPL